MAILDFREFNKFADKMNIAERDIKIFMANFLKEMALRVLADTKRNTPVDTGDLKNNWYLTQVNIQGSKITIEIYNTMDYATYVEYGHRQEVGRFVPAIGKRLKKPWVEGKFMCTLALAEIERQLPQRFRVKFDQWLNSMR